MQTKYKLEKDVYQSTLWIIRGQKRRELEYKKSKDDILNGGGAKYINYRNKKGKNCRAYLPSSRGNKKSETEVKALALSALEESIETQKMRAVQQALNEATQSIRNKELQLRIQESLMLNICDGRNFPFRMLNLPGISEYKFYNIKSKFIYLVSKKIQ